ncbi:MAG: hypothetical protein GEU99_06670 [Luteitalea sp.]|nr:hypothetical protein [Luteitalea sp.]
MRYVRRFAAMLALVALSAGPQATLAERGRTMAKGRPFVNQAGYNLGEAKRLTCPGAPDGTPFRIVRVTDNATLFRGEIRGFVGEFTAFDPPASRGDYVAEVEGYGRSVPFAIADHLMERISSRLAYQFFIDVRGGYTPLLSPANVTGGGPSRDGGGQGLEATFEGLLYASNPALFDRWATELDVRGERWLMTADLPPLDPRDPILELHPAQDGSVPRERMPDLIKLLLWHAEFAYNNHTYNGRTGGHEARPEGYEAGVRQFGYTDDALQNFDYQNLLDQLAAACAYYHAFLKPYMSRATYEKYRKVCLEKWEAYDRQKEVRYWVKSRKWIDEGRLEFNEQGSAFGQGLLRNLLMYLAEREEPNGEAERFLRYARACAEDIIRHWDFNNPVHTWRARNAEHITPQALALFLLAAPEQAPAGTREKLAAWREYLRSRTDNLWQYRTHDDHEWAHPKSKEVGTVAGMGGSAFAVAAVLDDPALRAIAWSQVDFVFGRNPAGAHLSHKSRLRVAMGGYWPDVEVGWPHLHGHGTGELAAVRGTLDGSPTDQAFPFKPPEAAIADRPGVYGTEGWSITNRAWMSTVTFSTLGSHAIRILDPVSGEALRTVTRGQRIRVELRAALNLDPARAETGWIEVTQGGASRRVLVRETGPDTSRFAADVTIAPDASEPFRAAYGYLAFRKTADVTIQ